MHRGGERGATGFEFGRRPFSVSGLLSHFQRILRRRLALLADWIVALCMHAEDGRNKAKHKTAANQLATALLQSIPRGSEFHDDLVDESSRQEV
jgi:hypothetical protein